MTHYSGYTGQIPEIGSERVFFPHALMQQMHVNVPIKLGEEVQKVTGICVYVNEEHRVARYRYEQPGGGTAWECFKF